MIPNCTECSQIKVKLHQHKVKYTKRYYCKFTSYFDLLYQLIIISYMDNKLGLTKHKIVNEPKLNHTTKWIIRPAFCYLLFSFTAKYLRWTNDYWAKCFTYNIWENRNEWESQLHVLPLSPCALLNIIK